MIRIIFLVSFVYFWFGVHALQGQAPSANFSIDASGCLNQNLVVQNLSTNATSFTWDFCFQDLNTVKEVKEAVTVNAAVSSTGISFFSQNGNWFGFVSSRDNNKLFRLDFGISLENTPSIVDLGNVGGLLSGPQSIVFIEENNIVYAILSNYNGSSLLRLSFPSGLSGVPLAQNLGSFGVVTPRGIDLVKDASNNITVAVADDNSKIVLIDFGTSILNNPTLVNAFDVAVGAGTRPIGIRLMNDGNNWFGFTSLFSGNVIKRIDFGSSLSSSVTLTDIYSVVNPTEISFQKEGLTTHLLVATMGGNVHHLKGISKPIDQIEASNLGRFGVLGNLFAFAVTRSAPIWFGFAIDYVSNIVTRIKFQGDCVSEVAINDSDQNTPQNIFYKSPGNYMIELTAYSTTEQDVDQQQITIQNIEAPIIEITTNSECVNSQVTFQANESTGLSLSSHSWDFGDGHTSSISIPSNQYGNTGTYSVTLDATASNSCANRVIKQLQIFNPPTASFLLPTGNPLCTNQNLTFTNTSISDTGSSPSWQWYVNDVAASTSKDLNFTFTSATNQTVKLKASIPGCFTEDTQTVNALLAGPNIDFNIVGKCQQEIIQFENLTTDAVNGFSWDFGDNQGSTSISPTHTYPTIGSYVVTLTADSPNGCLNSKVKPITIYTTPQTNFSLDLPPFSCSGSPSQFNDLTPAPTDSNIGSWNWSFGDEANGKAIIQHPTYIYGLAGSYSVSLTATTNFGCEATKLQTIQIAQSPKADFTQSASCINKPTLFTDASGANNKFWSWKIGGSSYTIQNPTHVFTAPGNFTSELMVTGNNGCISKISKPIVVPVIPSLEFSIQNTCATQATLFKDVTAPTGDAVVSHVWDFGGKGSGTGASTQFTFSSTGTYSVKLTTTNQSGCSYSLAKNTVIVPAPVADFSPSIDSGPPPVDVQFTNASKNSTSYLWQFNDPNNSTSTVESPSFIFTTLGDFNVILTASNAQGCQDTESKVIHVIVPSTDIELEQFTWLHDQLTGSVRPVLTIKNRSNYTISSMDVVLDIAGNAQVKERINFSILPNTATTQILQYELLQGNSKLDYLCAELQLTNDRLSDETDLANNSECVSLESNEILLPPYPNPTHGQLNFDWIAVEQGSVKLYVVTQMGQVAYQKDLVNVEVGLNRIVMDIANLNTGFYMLVVETAELRKTFPFVIGN